MERTGEARNACEWGGCDEPAVEAVEIHETLVTNLIRLRVCRDHLEEAACLYPDARLVVPEGAP